VKLGCSDNINLSLQDILSHDRVKHNETQENLNGWTVNTIPEYLYSETGIKQNIHKQHNKQIVTFNTL